MYLFSVICLLSVYCSIYLSVHPSIHPSKLGSHIVQAGHKLKQSRVISELGSSMHPLTWFYDAAT